MQTFNILKPYFKRYKKDVALALVAIIVSAFSSLYQPRLLENIQRAIMADQKQAVIQDGIILIALGIIAIVAGILMFIMLHELPKV